MLAVEAARLCEILIGRDDISPLLNLGSSTRAFRELDQPHVERALFAPLRRAGVSIFHCDSKKAEGVDLAGDVSDPEVTRALRARQFRCVLLANLLEHVPDRNAVAAAAEDIVGSTGLILATVPVSYPYHADPIDTLYRPRPAELAGLFARSRVLLAEEIVGPTFGEALSEAGRALPAEVARTLGWLLLFPLRPRSCASKLHRWLWYSRPYRVALVLLEVR
jgi:hypothetical protein